MIKILILINKKNYMFMSHYCKHIIIMYTILYTALKYFMFIFITYSRFKIDSNSIYMHE